MKLFTENELRDLTIAILVLAGIFSFPEGIFSFPELNVFLITVVIVFFSYALHELAHKFVARKFGCIATFKLWMPGILIGVVSMLFRALGLGLVFVAPGFVEIMPYSFGRWGFKVARLGKKELGLIALAGVGVNILFAIIFKILFNMYTGEIFRQLSFYNGLLALFNLIPVPPLDGSKVFLWEMWIWLFFIFITFLTVFIF